MRKIIELVCTCPAVPSQWEGKLDDGNYIFIHYRYGKFTVGIGPDIKTAVENSICKAFMLKYIGGTLDGFMEYPEMLDLLIEKSISLADDVQIINKFA